MLDGITRPKALVADEPQSPPMHSPLRMQNEVRYRVVGPDGELKAERCHVGNIMATFGLNNLCERVATGGEASSWVAAARIGTSTTAESSTHDSLIASTASMALSAASMAVSDLGSFTTEYQSTFASDNPAGAYELHEVGLFVNSTANSQCVARSELGTDSANVGASDEVQLSHRVIFQTG